jgi:peroxiredoxin
MSSEQNRNIPFSLNSRFQELDSERRRTWTADALAVYDNQRAELVREHSKHPFVGVGDILPDATLVRTDGTPISLDAVATAGPAVLIFFRFAGCPACNIALPYYRDTLWPALSAAQVPLVGISPQPITLLHEIVKRHQIPFPIASDENLGLSRALGITYVFNDASRKSSEVNGGTSQALNGTSSWELPKPAVIIIDQHRVVRFADVSPDWIVRTEAPAILDALRLSGKKASQVAYSEPVFHSLKLEESN